MVSEIIGAALPAVMAMIAEAVAQGDDAKAEGLRQQAMQQYNIELPPANQITPESAGQSQMAGATGDSTAKSARLDALRRLQEVSHEGYTAEDRAANNEMLGEVDQHERGNREAIQQRFAPGSGAGIAAQLSNQQNSAQVANKRGLELAAGGRRQALSALAQSGTMAGQIDESAYQQQAGRAQGADAMSRFNAANRYDAQKANANLGQQRFQNQMSLADKRSGLYQDESDISRGTGIRKRKMISGMGSSGQEGLYNVGKLLK